MIKNILILLLTLFIFLAIKPFFFGSSPDSLDQKIFSFITHPFSQKYYVGTEEEFVSKRLTSASNDEYINKIVKSSFNVNEEKEAVFKLFLEASCICVGKTESLNMIILPFKIFYRS